MILYSVMVISFNNRFASATIQLEGV